MMKTTKQYLNDIKDFPLTHAAAFVIGALVVWIL